MGEGAMLHGGFEVDILDISGPWCLNIGWWYEVIGGIEVGVVDIDIIAVHIFIGFVVGGEYLMFCVEWLHTEGWF